jgi:hypothetical protein
MSKHSSNNPVISAWVTDNDKREKLRIEAAKRGITLSRYAGLLLEKATNGYTDFDIEGYEETFKAKQYQRRKIKE